MKKALVAICCIAISAHQIAFSGNVGIRSESKYFTADVINIDRTRSGKVFVSIEFTAKLHGPEYLYISRDSAQCSQAATLVDSEGNEYSTNTCIERNAFANIIGGTNDGTKPLYLEADSKATFVFKFLTPQRTSNQPEMKYSLVAPVFFQVGNKGYVSTVSGSTTMSFFGLSDSKNDHTQQ
jgi:hypothetical protein